MALITALCSAALADEWQQLYPQKLQHCLQTDKISTFWGCNDQRINLYAALIRFYQHRQYRPAWVDSNGLLPEGEAVLTTLQQADGQGLKSPDYYQRMLDDFLNGMHSIPVADRPIPIERHIKLDVMLTGMILRYAFYISNGRTDPSIVEFGAKSGAVRHRDLAVELSAKRESGHLASFLRQLEPQHPAYRTLKKSLLQYRKVKAEGGWPTIEQGPRLQFGDRGARVAMLRYRLSLSKDADFGSRAMNDRFDDALAASVMRFQRRHGLKADGVVGPGTLAAINVPVDQRIRQIELNLERWRWMPAQLAPYHILVNIPAFELKVVDNGQTVKTMRTIVGREERPTPMISSTMTYLELNPYWHVPQKIARKDLLPKIRKDPQFLIRQNFQVFNSWKKNARALDPLSINWATLNENNFPYRLCQKPTPHNALGRVKFMFPNAMSVYIHDTPSKRLFRRSSRSFSSGCVRIERPLELATFLLKRQNWNPQQFKKILASGQRQAILLKEPVPVYLVYLTAWAAENGDVHFREDIYGHDLELQTLLAQVSETEQRCAAVVLPTDFVQNHPADHLPGGPLGLAQK